MAQDASQITIGACDVTWNNVDIGHTLGGAKVTYTPSYADIKADLYGDTPYDKRLTGELIEITMTLVQWDLDVVQDAGLPIAGTESATKRTYGSEAAASLRSKAARLVLHPSRLDGSDRSEDIVVYKAAVHNAVTINFENSNEKGMEVTFIGLIDTDNASGNLLFMMGDSTT